MSECEMLPNIVNSVRLVFDILGVVILFFTVSAQGFLRPRVFLDT